MATNAPAGMEWQSYFDGFNSVSDILNQSKKPGLTSQLLGHAINAMTGMPTDIATKLGGDQPFGAPAIPQGSVPSPTSPQTMTAPVVPGPPSQLPPFTPQVNGQMTQPPIGTNLQQPSVTQTPSYTRFLFAP